MSRKWLRSLVLSIGAINAGSAMISGAMNPDGVCYLDMGDAFFRGDWSTALTSVWSPLYSLLLGMAVQLTDPGPRWEFVVVQAVNFLVFLFALIGFEFLWGHLLRGRREAVVRREDIPVRFDWWPRSLAAMGTSRSMDSIIASAHKMGRPGASESRRSVTSTLSLPREVRSQ